MPRLRVRRSGHAGEVSGVWGDAMKRRLVNLVTLLSLLLCVAVVGLWVRSYRVSDILERSNGHRHFALHSVNGLMGVVFQRLPDDVGRHGLLWTVEDVIVDYSAGRALVRFEWRTSHILFPQWVIVILSATLPAVTLRRIMRRRRRVSTACGHCGYDLRATPDRCPECGATP